VPVTPAEISSCKADQHAASSSLADFMRLAASSQARNTSAQCCGVAGGFVGRNASIGRNSDRSGFIAFLRVDRSSMTAHIRIRINS
jgi:hypothetical protein